jgi:hypothetical protein
MTTRSSKQANFQDLKSRVTEGPRRMVSGYSKQDVPLAEYAGLVGLFHASFAAFLLARRNANLPLPERIDLRDILLLGIATHKLSRVITRDRIMSFVRAPFTRREKSAGAGEVEEQPRGTGVRKAVGELLTCPYCIGTWISSALLYGFILKPRYTRVFASIFAINTVSEFLQQGYAKAKELNE